MERWAGRIGLWSEGGEPDDAQRFTAIDWGPLHSPSNAAPGGGVPSPRRKRRDGCVYFDDDAKGNAPFNAMRRAEMVQAAGAATR